MMLPEMGKEVDTFGSAWAVGGCHLIGHLGQAWLELRLVNTPKTTFTMRRQRSLIEHSSRDL